jgi:hypothetical protein
MPKEEGVQFEFLAAPVGLEGDERGVLTSMQCICMKLGAPDASGRPTPIPIPGSEFVVAAVGQGPNLTPPVQRATPTLVTKNGKISINEFGATSMPDLFAGGDVARGGSPAIQAMRDGRAVHRPHSACKADFPSGFTAGDPCDAVRHPLSPRIGLGDLLPSKWKHPKLRAAGKAVNSWCCAPGRK